MVGLAKAHPNNILSVFKTPLGLDALITPDFPVDACNIAICQDGPYFLSYVIDLRQC